MIDEVVAPEPDLIIGSWGRKRFRPEGMMVVPGFGGATLPRCYPEPSEFKRARADRMLTHVSRRDMTGIDRGIPGSEQCEKGRLRLLQAEGDFIVAVRGDRFEVPVPGLAGIDAQLLARLPVSISQVHSTSFAVKGLPSCQVTP